jgi:hypothetical protein
VNPRKLLDWRKFLIYSHRWVGILSGLLFITWFFSGVMMMYWNAPSFTAAERLSHMAPIDQSAARIDPVDAARNAEITPTSLRVGMYYDGRPVYRFQGDTTVYADTGEVIGGLDKNQALDLVQKLVPAHASTLRYDSLMQIPDQWTLPERFHSLMPIHRIAVGDPEDTYYYISGKTGEPVIETDRAGRFWGFLSTILHLHPGPKTRIGTVEQVHHLGAIRGKLVLSVRTRPWHLALFARSAVPSKGGKIAFTILWLDAVASLRRPSLWFCEFHLGFQRRALDQPIRMVLQHRADCSTA